MPSRPRAHVLETESQDAFKRALPMGWVVRKIDEDYGVDREVEIFEEGRATGLTFKVQLKGTDGRRRSRNVKIDTLAYWRRLDVPVLVVLLHASKGKLYARWAHAHDSHLYPAAPPEKTTAFTFDESEELTSVRVGQLVGDVKVFRQLRTGPLPRPIPLNLVIETTLIDEEDLRAALRSSLSTIPDVIKLVSRAASYQVEALIADDRVTVGLPVQYRMLTVHTDAGTIRSYPPGTLAADILLAVAVLLARIGKSSEAARLTDAVGSTALLTGVVEIALDLVPALLAGPRELIHSV